MITIDGIAYRCIVQWNPFGYDTLQIWNGKRLVASTQSPYSVHDIENGLSSNSVAWLRKVVKFYVEKNISKSS